MKTLYIVRGVPGSGKSTLAEKIAGPQHFHEADQYFINKKGQYKYDHRKIKLAHEWCKKMIEIDMLAGTEVIAVSNTFVKRWEMDDYRDMAEKHGYSVFEIVCNNRFENQHGVPHYKLMEMWENFQR